ncbi:MAG: UbiD family decarboxylase [Candidatus Micrarchaeia archaeon]
MEFKKFVRKLDDEHKLVHVTKEASTSYEIAAYLKKYDGTPVMFDSVRNESGAIGMPVVGNLLSSMDLLCGSLGIDKDSWIGTMARAIENPRSVAESSTNPFDYFEPDLGMLPILKHYPKDQGAYITSAVVFAEHNGARNASFHRLSVLGKDRLVGRLVEQRDLHTMYTDAKAHGEDLNVAIAIGNSTGVLVAGATTVARGFDELTIASALENGMEVVKGKTASNVLYPANSEIVLEGRILHDETAKEGPFVDLTNTYDVVREQPVFVIDKIAMQKQPIYQALLPGGNEHKILMGAPRTPTIYKALKSAGIDVANVYLTEGGSGWLDAVIAIRKHDDDEPRRAINAAIEGHKSLKKITIVDDDIDVTNPNDVNYAVTMYWRAGKELVIDNVKGSSLDPMGTPEGMGSKLAIDATRPAKVPEEKLLKMKKASMDFKIDA